MELFQFQEKAAATVADRFLEYLDDPARAGTAKNPRTVPFFQSLSSLTGSGKTLVLAEAVSQVAATMPIKPVIMWLSKGKVVVRQAYANLSPGGKYHDLLEHTTVMTLAEYDPDAAGQSTDALLCFATVGTFNQKDKEEGSLTIFQSDIDTTETSTWAALKRRTDVDGNRRPLIVVYDEGHNLTDQQTELLLELQPDGFLLASATMRLPNRLNQEVETLKQSGWEDATLVTHVEVAAVVDSDLIKSTIDLAGYNTPMEETVSNMLAEMRLAVEDAAKEAPIIRPKAIYVCNTNMTVDNPFVRDDPKQPFGQRLAPPIVIWRFLVEQCDVDPSTIAVYARLDTHKDFPLPDDFVLFRGGDKDYEGFTAGDYQHVIFNQSLQEGWDDAEVYFAYVDKSMDSPIQVTQLIGRVLRQPNVTRYRSERLNTAHFYVRVDRNEVFNAVVKEVEAELGGSLRGPRIVATPPGKERPVAYPPKVDLHVPMTGLDGSGAQSPIAKLLAEFPDFRGDTVNTVGRGFRRAARQKVGGAADGDTEWEEYQHASQVSARWVFHREVQRRYKQALNVVNLAEPKLNAVIGVGSPAYAQTRSLAEKVVEQYISDVLLVQRGPNPYVSGPISARSEELVPFTNAIHEGYSGLNPALELPFAEALDRTGFPWCRNPSRIGYGIDLVSVGPTAKFYPDFIVWTDARVVLVDTKGAHLVAETAGRKLLYIRSKPGAERTLDVQFVSKGHWSDRLQNVGPDGHTLWGLNSQGDLVARHFDELEELITRLVIDKPA